MLISIFDGLVTTKTTFCHTNFELVCLDDNQSQCKIIFDSEGEELVFDRWSRLIGTRVQKWCLQCTGCIGKRVGE